MLYNNVVYEFNNRYNYIIKINEEKDDELKYKLKRKYIGIYKLLVFYTIKKINIHLVNKIVSKLLEFNKTENDIECLHSLFQKINVKDIDKDLLIKMKDIFDKIELNKFKNRIKFLSYDFKDWLE